MSARVFRFEDFVLDASAYALSRQGRRVKVERRPMDLLMLLLDRRGQLVTRDEIVERLWGPNVFIEIDTSVNTAIRKVRRALRDSADRSRFVETVPGKGYRFIAEVDNTGVSVLAVLPFENLRDDQQDYLADGVTEETIAGLGRIDPDRLRVIGRTSSMAYRRTRKSLTEIGRELDADYLLEGSVRRDDERIRVTATLVRAKDQVQIWSERYDREARDLLGVQAELGQSIARHIQLWLSPQRAAAIARRQTTHAGAFDLYLRGRYYYAQMTAATAARALECFREAVTLDASYALAWAGIADTYSSRLFTSDTRPSDVAELARVATTRAMTHGSMLAEVRTAMAAIQFLFDWDWSSAEANLRDAVMLNPNVAQSHWMLGHALSQQLRHTEAIAAAGRALALEPRDALTATMAAQIAFSSRDFEAAAQHARHALLIEPDFWIAYWQLGQALDQLARADEALEALSEASRLSKRNSKPLSVAAYLYGRTGRVDQACTMIASLEQESHERYVPPVALALAYTGVSDYDRAFGHLEDAAVRRDVHLIYLLVDAKWDPLRQDHRFRDLLMRTRLAR